MKKLSFLTLIAAIGLASCGEPVQQNTIDMSSANDGIPSMTTRAVKTFEEADRFSLADVNINLDELATVTMTKMQAAEDDDAAFISALGSNFAMAENAQALDVQFAMSEEPVDNGVFIYSIDSEDEKELTMEMYDEEGFDLAAQNQLTVTNGKNYKALNVKAMDNGSYIFRLKNEEGAELVRTVEVDNE